MIIDNVMKNGRIIMMIRCRGMSRWNSRFRGLVQMIRYPGLYRIYRIGRRWRWKGSRDQGSAEANLELELLGLFPGVVWVTEVTV